MTGNSQCRRPAQLRFCSRAAQNLIFLHAGFYPDSGAHVFNPTHAGFAKSFTSLTRWCLPVSLQLPLGMRMGATPELRLSAKVHSHGQVVMEGNSW